MGLNESKGNMYDFVNKTWNTIKGACPHDCSYCSIKRIAKRFNQAQRLPRFDKKEMSTDLGRNNFIFVGSSNDLFANAHPYEWITNTLTHCRVYSENKYLFQTKNPQEMLFWESYFPKDSAVCITLESNRHYHKHMGNSPTPFVRAMHYKRFINKNRYITIEPIMDFGLGAFVDMIRAINPIQVNIGADSGNNNLPEPEWEKVERLIKVLQRFTIVKEKPNLDRLRRAT